MISRISCYHHSNCDDRPAVATCTKCGKGLCAECADKLRSPSTGKILCVDCLNAELESTAVKAVRARKTTKRELITIIVGFVIGVIMCIVLANTLPAELRFIAFFMPTLFASLGTIWQICRGYGFFIGLLFFIGLMLVSPIIFIWRLVVRIRDMVNLKRFAIYQIRYRNANENYFKIARSMTSKRADPEQIRRELENKYAALRQSDKAAYERKVNEEVTAKVAEIEKTANEKIAEMDRAMAELKDAQKGMVSTSNGVEKASKGPGRRTTHDRESIEV